MVFLPSPHLIMGNAHGAGGSRPGNRKGVNVPTHLYYYRASANNANNSYSGRIQENPWDHRMPGTEAS